MNVMRSVQSVVRVLGFSAGVVLLTADSSRAAFISPVNATASSFYSDPSGDGDIRSPDHVIDGSGLTGNQHTDLPGAGVNNSDPDTMWISNGERTPTITFELAATPVDTFGFHLWNYNEITNRGIRQTTISASNDNVTYTPLIDPVSNTTTFTFVQASGLSNYTGEAYALPLTAARYIRFGVLDNFPSSAPFTGLSEIMFAVPEPTTAGIMAVVALAAAAHQRRRAR